MKMDTWAVVFWGAAAAITPVLDDAAVASLAGGAVVTQSSGGAGEAQSDSGTFKDPRDGQVYKWVRIGDQVWMAENLRFATESGSWCWENRESECATRGRLYNWETACRVAPPGWRLPSDEDWKQLERTLGLTPEQIEDTGIDRGGDTNRIGAALKKRGAWPTEYEGAPVDVTDETGFSAIQTGLFGPGGFNHDAYTGWWSSTESGDRAWIRVLRFFDSKMGRDLNNKWVGFPVRCIKETEQ